MTNILNHDNVKPVVAVVTEDLAEYYQADKTSINQLVTTSQIVAAYFEKKHCDVLRIINNIKTQFCVLTSSQSPKSNFDSMFYVASYESGTGKRYKMYFMTRDGFTLLAMGFTGKKTLADESTGIYRAICKVYAANILAGKEVLPLPEDILLFTK